MPDDKITQEDAASYLESDAYGKLPQAKKDEVIKFLKTNMVRGTPDVLSASRGVLERRRQTGGMTDERSALGHLATGVQTGVEGVVGLPGAVKRAAMEPPTEYEKGRAKRHPFIFAEPQKGVGLTLDRLFFDPQFREASKARESFKGGKVSEGLGHAGASVLPGAGPWAAGIGEQVGKGEWLDALGEQGVYALVGLAGKKMLKGVDPHKRLSAATGGGAKEFESVMGDLAQTAKKVGKPKTVNELYELVKRTGRDMETDFNQALQPLAGQQVMPSDVARNLLKEADKFDRHTPEGRAARQYLRQRAIDYQKPWTLGELNQKRMKMFDSTLESKTQVKQMGSVRADVERLADKTIEDSLRDLVYGEMDARYKGANFKGLKEKQAKLLDLNHRLQNRVSDIADKQAAYETAGPMKKAGFYVRGHATGLTPAVHPKFEGSPEKAAGGQIKKAFSRLRNPIKAKPAGERRLPPLEPETPSSPQTPPKSSPSATAGHSERVSYEDSRRQAERELGSNADLSVLHKRAKEIRDGVKSEGDVDEVTRRGPGNAPEVEKDLATRKAVAERSKEERGRKLPSLEKEHGEEVAKAANENSPDQARHYQEKAAKKLFNKTYDELSTSERIKTLSEGAKLQDEARKAKHSYTEWKGKGVTVKGKPGTVIGTSFGSLTIKLSDGSIVRVTPDEIKPGLSPLK